ncbi:MAG: CHASE2 domain-containing protein [Deltaproteobacteria bacterium]|nr:CHASE2 domain-containing protein [Deltaproteobacteria bacterium]
MQKKGGARGSAAAIAQTPWRPSAIVFRFAAYWVYFAIGTFLFTKLDRFGFELATRKYSQDLVNQIFGSEYPDGYLFGWHDGTGSPRGQDLITVVLAEQTSLDAWAEYWPPTFGFHAEVLDQICMRRPKAVFIDIIFRDRRGDGTLEKLQAAIHRCVCANVNDGNGVDVYLASPTEAKRSPILPELLTPGACGRKAVAVRVPKVTDAQDRGNREYPLVYAQADGTRSTAALQLFQKHLCREDETESRCGPSLERYRDTMQLFWGTRLARFSDQDCQLPDNGVLRALTARILGNPEKFRLNCPYTQTITALNLLQAPLVHTPDNVTPLVTGKVVLYAMHVSGSGDLVYPATHKKLPGVYLHAMAIDNLVTYGDRYLRAIPEGIEIGTDGITLRVITFDALVFSLFAAVAAVLRIRRERNSETEHPTHTDESSSQETAQRVSHLRFAYRFGARFALWLGARVGVPIVVVVLAGTVGLRFFRLAPLNWFGFILLAESADWLIEIKERVAGAIDQSWSESTGRSK